MKCYAGNLETCSPNQPDLPRHHVSISNDQVPTSIRVIVLDGLHLGCVLFASIPRLTSLLSSRIAYLSLISSHHSKKPPHSGFALSVSKDKIYLYSCISVVDLEASRLRFTLSNAILLPLRLSLLLSYSSQASVLTHCHCFVIRLS